MFLPETSKVVLPFSEIHDLPDHDCDETRHNIRKGSA